MRLICLYAPFIARAHGLYRLVSIMSAGETRGKMGCPAAAEERVTMRTRRPKTGVYAYARVRRTLAHVRGCPASDGMAL